MVPNLANNRKKHLMLEFSKNKIEQAWEEIKKAKSITLLTHFKPDGDGISACAAISHICKRLSKNIETIYPSNAEFEIKRSPANILVNKHNQIPELIIMCDTANYERLYFPKEFELIKSINIDHHISNTINSTYNFVDPDASSTCEILYKLIKEWNTDLIDKYIAETLLFGILYDSQVFHTQATTSETLKVSAELISHGANLFELKTELLSQKTTSIISLWGTVLKNIQVSPKKTAVWAKITQQELKKHNATLKCLIGFNNFLSELSGIDITLLFYETANGQTKVSLRSKKADVNLLASRFGGGGHTNASGILSDKPIDELISEITTLL